MRRIKLTARVAAVVCGLWLIGLSLCSAQEDDEPRERVESIQLRGGVMDIVTVRDEEGRYAKVRFKGHEIDLGYGGALHYETIRLADREIVIIQTWGDVRGMPPDYFLVAVTFQGVVKHIENSGFSSADGTFKVRRQGNVLYFDLGFAGGLKTDAMLSGDDLTVFSKKVARPAFDEEDCKWLHDALNECVRSGEYHPCNEVDHSMSTVRGLSALSQNPRWKIAERRFDAACEIACKAKKRPPYSQFAKNICGP